MAFVEAFNLDELKPGSMLAKIINNEHIAFYNVNNKIYATSSICLHEQANLDEGDLTDDIVMCPRHGWRYNVTNGHSINMPSMKLKVYQVKIVKNKVLVNI